VVATSSPISNTNPLKHTIILFLNLSATTAIKDSSERAADIGRDTDYTTLKTAYTGCPRRNVPDFGRAFLMLKYTDITQNTYTQS
jgi:hypothetical protein